MFFILLLTVIGCETKDKSSNELSENGKSKSKSTNEKIETVEYKCNDMFCTGCEEKISGEIKKLDGIKEVKADYKTKLVSVTFEGNLINKESIQKAINDAGYETENVKTDKK